MRCESDLIAKYKKDQKGWSSVDFQHSGNGFPDVMFVEDCSLDGGKPRIKFVEFKFVTQTSLAIKKSMFRPVQLRTLRWLLDKKAEVFVVVGNSERYEETGGEELSDILRSFV